MKIIKEIRAVGLRDWWYFVVVLKRDEFHVDLSLWRYYMEYGMEGLDLVIRDRDRAHEIDIKLRDL